MSASLCDAPHIHSWAPPVFGNANQTSQAYLQRLQDFLAAQSGGDSSMSNSSSTDKPNNKRKGPASNAEIDTTAALKDSRRQSSSGSGSGSTSTGTAAAQQRGSPTDGQTSQQHSHADQQRSGASRVLVLGAVSLGLLSTPWSAWLTGDDLFSSPLPARPLTPR